MTSTPPLKWLRVAIILVLVGFAVEFVALLHLTPATFVAFAFLGLPCLGLGMLMYVIHVIRDLRRKDAL